MIENTYLKTYEHVKKALRLKTAIEETPDKDLKKTYEKELSDLVNNNEVLISFHDLMWYTDQVAKDAKNNIREDLLKYLKLNLFSKLEKICTFNSYKLVKKEIEKIFDDYKNL